MKLTEFILHYVCKLLYKSELFWPGILTLHFCDYPPLPPFEEELAFSLNKLEFRHARMICTKFDCKWPPGPRKDFSKYKHSYISPIVAPPNP
jgi:hypothetical protein